jgi:hypothetical protein
MKLCSAGDPAREGLISNFAIGVIFIFAMTLALLIMGQSRPWSVRYLFLAFNSFQRGRHYRRGKMLNSLRAVTSEPPLKGDRRVASGGSRQTLSEA